MTKFIGCGSVYTWHRDPECHRAQAAELSEATDDEIPRDATGCTACTDFPSAVELERKIQEGL